MRYNDAFAVEPENTVSAFRPLSPMLNIDAILCVKLTRSVDAGGVFSFYNRHFKVITGSSLPLLPPKSKVNVLIGPRLGVKVQFKNAIFDVLPYIKAQKSADAKPAADTKAKTPWIPPDSHYYKYGHQLIKKVTFEDSDRDILLMLESIFLKQYA